MPAALPNLAGLVVCDSRACRAAADVRCLFKLRADVIERRKEAAEFIDLGFDGRRRESTASADSLADMRSGINRRCYNENPILCSSSAHEYGRALPRPVTVRAVGAVPSTITAMMRGERKARGASRLISQA
jgi:hypothetical protein